MVNPLIGLAGLSASGGETQRAARLLGAAQGAILSSMADISVYPADQADYEYVNSLVRDLLAEDTFEQLIEEGRAMAEEGVDRVIEYALETGMSNYTD